MVGYIAILGQNNMGLFDKTPDRAPERKLKKPATIKKAKKEEPKKISHKTARQVLTEKWERGEIKFEYGEATLEICTCCQSPDFHQFPHPWHRDEEHLFDYHRRLRWKPQSSSTKSKTKR